MCLIKGMDQVICSHPTCFRATKNPDFFTHTKKSVFKRRGDFNKVRLQRNAENKPIVISPVNSHIKNTDTRASFSKFQEYCTLKAAGTWPREIVLNKWEIEIQYFLYARRLQGDYNALTDEYEYRIIIDVEEAAVYVGNETIVEH